MTRFGFVINQATCIGCHACTIACKSENEVPLGAFRTWVKYVEKGRFPDTKRHFAVLRCNQCEDAPCMTICPTTALFRRDNGIVDFDQDLCIGCKSCMQACPYDALYINPLTNTAEKCNFCAHRVETGLKPACEVVCPERSIISGDMDDPHSEVSQFVAKSKVQVRKPEQGTRPRVFYVEADAAALDPGATNPPQTYLWSQVRPDASETFLQAAAPELAQDIVRKVYDVDHPQPWGWKVSAYLWTKAIAAGSLLVAALRWDWDGSNKDLLTTPPILALIFLTLTTLLLITDLKRPERFWMLILRPNLSSWLVWGGFILMAYGGAASLWLLLGFMNYPDLVQWVMWPTAALAIAAAGYSAFLFGQCEGRDFWQSPLLFWHLTVGALVAGAATLLIVFTAIDPREVALTELFRGFVWRPDSFLTGLLTIGLVAHALVLIGELLVPHANADSKKAARLIVRGQLAAPFWVGAVALGIVAPLSLMWVAPVPSAVLALIGLGVYEHLWIKAGQSIPLS